MASAAGGTAAWATIPDRNLGQSTWNQYIEFASLGAGIVPDAGVWADAQLEVTVTADPAAGALLGPGDSVNVTVTVRNAGSAALPSLTVGGTATGGLSLTNAPQSTANLAPSATVGLVLNATAAGDGSLALTLADSYHRPYALTTLAYTVDSAAPISVSVAITTARPFTNTVLGFAQDASPLGLFEVEVSGGGGTQVIACPVTGQAAGSVACAWNPGAVAGGATFSLRARAADVHGNTSGWSAAVPVVIDATPPQLALSAATVAALSDGRLNARELALSGTLTDTVAAGDAQLCTDDANTSCTAQSVLPDSSWSLSAPSLGDGVTTTLAFTGYDLAGNASQALTETVIIDTVAPVLGATTLNPGAFTGATAALLGYGTVTDGGGVAAVQLYVVRPDGSSTVVTADAQRRGLGGVVRLRPGGGLPGAGGGDGQSRQPGDAIRRHGDRGQRRGDPAGAGAGDQPGGCDDAGADVAARHPGCGGPADQRHRLPHLSQQHAVLPAGRALADGDRAVRGDGDRPGGRPGHAGPDDLQRGGGGRRGRRIGAILGVADGGEVRVYAVPRRAVTGAGGRARKAAAAPGQAGSKPLTTKAQSHQGHTNRWSFVPLRVLVSSW